MKTIPPAEGDETAPLQLLVMNIDYNDYVGRLAIGKIFAGTAKVAEPIGVVTADRRTGQDQDHLACSRFRA